MTDQTVSLIRRLSERLSLEFDETKKRIEGIQSFFMRENRGRKLSMGNLFRQFGVSIEENCAWRSELFNPEDYLDPDKTLASILSGLETHFSLAAVTNNTVHIGKRTLNALGVERFFPVIIGLDTSLVSKPHERPFRLACEALGLPCSRLVSIGDRFEVDIELPLVMGMGGILVESMADTYSLPETLQTVTQ